MKQINTAPFSVSLLFTGCLLAGNSLATDQTGDDGDNEIIGTNSADVLRGLGGNDTLRGLGGNDQLFGDLGDDILFGGAGNDQLFGGGGEDSLFGGEGEDILSATWMAPFALALGFNPDEILIDGGDGIDTAILLGQEALSGATNLSVNINLGDETSLQSGFIVKGIENLTTGNGSDRLIGNADNNILFSQGGDDTLSGKEGNDILEGGTGDDVLRGGSGNDILNGGAGIDLASYIEAESRVFVDLSHVGQQNTLGDGLDTLIGIENLEGSRFDDILFGDNQNNVIDGGAVGAYGASGDDDLFGMGGDDTLLGRKGDDSLNGGSGDDLLVGGEGNDRLNGGIGNDTASYLSSNGVTVDLSIQVVQDTQGAGLDLLQGIENLIGSGGSDVLSGDAGNNRLDGFRGNDSLNGGGGDDHLIGGEGDDYLFGGTGNDQLEGGQGNDVLEGGAGQDIIDGGDGNDWVSYKNNAGAVVVNLQTGTTSGSDSDSLINIENIEGSSGADILIGDAGDNVFSGGFGDDQMFGGAGQDTVDYSQAISGVSVNLEANAATTSQGTDRFFDVENLTGSDYDDVLRGNGQDNVLSGGAGDDLLLNTDGNDTFIGGDGHDTVSYRESFNGVTVDLGDGRFDSIETLEGSRHSDFIEGDLGDNILSGQAGDDVIIGGSGNDTLIGGDGNDTLDGSSVHPIFSSFQSDNHVNLDGGDGDDTLIAQFVTGVIDGGSGNDTAVLFQGIPGLFSPQLPDMRIDLRDEVSEQSGFVVRGIENVTTGGGNDTLIGNADANILSGMDGDDILNGQEGDDVLIGGEGNDYVIGDDGNDLLFGGGGDDIINGGQGIDTASYADSQNAVSVDLRIFTAQQTDKSAGGDLPPDCQFTDLPPELCPEGPAAVAATDVMPDQATTSSGIDTISNVENLTGSQFDDDLYGDNSANRLEGGQGNDRLEGNGGNDVLNGGEGDDILLGGAGIDTADYSDADAGVTVYLATQRAFGGAGNDQLNSIEVVQGSQHNDNLNGDIFNNTLIGGDGDDRLNGAGGFDVINAGDGDDTITAGYGRDTIDGGEGIDTVQYISSESVYANLSQQYAVHGVFRDVLRNVENLTSGFQNDQLIGSSANNQLSGMAGNDVLSGLAGDDTLLGGVGDDVLNGGEGNDYLDGGLGNDTASYADATAGVSVRLYTEAPQDTVGAGTDTLINIENLTGSQFKDTLRGDNDANVLDGGAGSDALYGYGGDDILRGGTGGSSATLLQGERYNYLNGGEGNDTVDYSDASAGITISLGTNEIQRNLTANRRDVLFSIENLTGSAFDDTLSGDDGDNILRGGAGHDILSGEGGDDVLEGGAGLDTASYASAQSGVEVNLAISGVAQDTQSAGMDTLVDIENLVGSAYNDTLHGTRNGVSKLSGGAGNDTLIAQGAQTTLEGDEGNDLLISGVGNDHLDGGEGVDTASYRNSNRGVTVSLQQTTQSNAYGTDTLVNIENLEGSSFSDSLTGNIGSNHISGGLGNDVLYGYNGSDTLVGGAGNDVINGGAGIDTASYIDAQSGVNVSLMEVGIQDTGGSGHDQLTGIENLKGSNHDDELIGDTSGNRLDGGDGNDRLLGGSGHDVLLGGAGNDYLHGGTGTDTANYAVASGAVNVTLFNGTARGEGVDQLVSIENVIGSAFGDVLTGDIYNNSLSGGDGDDRLNGGHGNDVISGGDGDDTIIAGLGLDFIYGGDGSDTVIYNTDQRVNANLHGEYVFHNGTQDRLFDVENLTTGYQNDVLAGNSADNTFRSGSGDDILSGDEGNDQLFGQAGNDILNGGAGDDLIDGGEGIDTVSYHGASAGVTVRLHTASPQNTVGAGTDTLINIENIIGTRFKDTLRGDNNANVIDGGDGSDSLYGYGGDDVLRGGTGGSGATMLQGERYNYLNGGEGNDTVDYSDATAGITINLGSNDIQRNLSANRRDVLYNIENVLGSAFDDVFTGTSQNNVLNGAEGNDSLNGFGGQDVLIGGSGDDVYVWDNAQSNDSVIQDSSGFDTLTYLQTVQQSDIRLELIGTQDLNIKLSANNQMLIEDQYQLAAQVLTDAPQFSEFAIDSFRALGNGFSADLNMGFDDLITSGQFVEMGIIGQAQFDNIVINHHLLDLQGRLFINNIFNNNRVLQVAENAVVENNGVINNDGNINNLGIIVNNQGGVINMNGDNQLAGNLVNNGVINIPLHDMLNLTGALGGAGVFNGAVRLDGAQLNPGNSPGLITFGNLALNDAMLNMEIEGFSRGTSYDAVDVRGDLTLESLFSLSIALDPALTTASLFNVEFEFMHIAGDIFDGAGNLLSDLSNWLPALEPGWFADWRQDASGWHLYVSFGNGHAVNAPASGLTWLTAALALIWVRRRKHIANS